MKTKKMKKKTSVKDSLMKRKSILIGGLLIGIIFFVLVLPVDVVSAYQRAYVQTNTGYTPLFGDGFVGSYFNREMCGTGQDFILQIDPLGCIPSVVRSDLLEDQNVPVFCPIVATQLNPLIDIEAIKAMTLTGQYPREVEGVGFFPARAALGFKRPEFVNMPVLDNLGYAVIVLRRQQVEADMPDFVEGNLTARITYDIKNAYGVGAAEFYLPEMTNEEWNRAFRQYGFWQGRGYLRAEGIGDDRATIAIYSDRETHGFSSVGDKRVISRHTIRVGESSPQIPMPGFNYCLGSMEIKLNGLEDPDTRARLRINEDVFEVKDGERFLDNQCQIINLEKQGVVERVNIKCNEDEKTSTINLIISPKISLSIDGQTGEYFVGDKLYDLLGSDGKETGKYVYLGYVGLTDDNRIFIVPVVSTAKNSEEFKQTVVYKALPTAMKTISFDSGNIVGNALLRLATGIFGGVTTFAEWVRSGDSAVGFVYEDGTFVPWPTPSGLLDSFKKIIENEDLYRNKFEIKGYADAKNINFPSNSKGLSSIEMSDLRTSYNKAMKDYQTIKESFSSDRYPPQDPNIASLGENALREAINLAFAIGQKGTVLELCDEFNEIYDKPIEGLPEICGDLLKLSSSENSVAEVLIQGTTYLIALDTIVEPSPEDYGVSIMVEGAGESFNGQRYLMKNQRAYLSESEYITLIDLERDYAVFDIRAIDRGTQVTTIRNTVKVNINSFEVLGVKNYKISVAEINLKKVAKVSIRPDIRHSQTTADFNFRIGIEKRAIQLSPEKTKEKIESIESKLEKWKNINNRIEPIIRAGKLACYGVGAGLMIKNFFDNFSGKGIARQKVMRSDGGWFEICETEVNRPGSPYGSVDSCLLDKSNEIEASVNEYAKVMEEQNKRFKELQEGITTSSFLGEKVVDTDKLMDRYVDGNYKNVIYANLQGVGINTVRVGNDDVPVSNITNVINSETVYLTQAKNLELNAKLLNSKNPDVAKIARTEIEKELANIWVNSRHQQEKISFAEEIGRYAGFENIDVTVLGSEDSKTIFYTGGKTTELVEDIPANVLVQGIIYENEKYFVELEKIGLDNYRVVKIYDEDRKNLGSNLDVYKEIKRRAMFKYFDRTTYQNKFANPELKYYETGTYAGLPAVVPFDLQNGWYAGIKSTLPIGGNIKAYDDSGRVSSFWLCNVGRNGREEFFRSDFGDDHCQQINLGTGQPYNVFLGLSASEAETLVSLAVNAIEEASKRYGAGVSRVTIQGQSISVGEPATGVPGIQCQDFMSPIDCNILFNVCDPFICPSSRCNLGGNYYVRDVVQSGIAGSIALCLPNWPEIKVPVCLTGIHAGIDGLISVGEAYQQCLQTSLDTGETVGICDEIYSIYLCDFVWRQALPVIRYVAPQIISSVVGQGTRGGGEYLNVIDAFQTAESSASYFTQYYAVESFKAFQARSLEGVGTEICKNWISINAPDGGGILDSLIAPDSPPQFYGKFDEMPYTTVTSPPTSHYKVFFHIYAGKDFPAYYQVYLRGSAGSFYQDTGVRRIVDTDFIPVGQSATQTIDFTAPTGYNELCIVVNNYEECGFKQVTTDMGVNYITEQYVADEARRTDVTTEAECVSGSVNIKSIINPNIQAGVEEAINPAIYNRGIIRVCATDNPGSSTDPMIGTGEGRWQAVGYCGNTRVTCWLDTESVKDTLKFTNIENEVIGEVKDNYLDILKNESGFIVDFKALVERIESEEDLLEKIEMINVNLPYAFFSYEKGYLNLLRGNAYASFAKGLYEKSKKFISTSEQLAGQQPSEELTGENPTDNKLIEARRNLGVSYPIFEFRDGSFSSNIYYGFSNNQWFWCSSQCSDKNNFYSVNDFSTEVFEKLPDKNKDFIKKLVGMGYQQGIGQLLQRTTLNDEGRMSLNAKLSTERIDFSHEGLFTINVGTGLFGKDIHFKFENGVWKWSRDKKTWVNVLGTSVQGEIWETSDAEYLRLIRNLEGKFSIEGAAIIFGIDALRPVTGPEPTVFSGTVERNSRSIQEVSNVVNLALQQGILNPNCKSYVQEVYTVARDNGIPDPLLMVALMQQESGCSPRAVSIDKSSWGLMQINAQFHCGNYGLSSNPEECRSQLLENTALNIDVGAQILVMNYRSGPTNYKCKAFTSNNQNEPAVNIRYIEWAAALRRYNGVGCAGFRADGSEIFADHGFVEKVMDRYNSLRNIMV